jgi:hypothetical protein
VEDIVYSLSHGEPQFVCHRRDLFDDLKGSILFGVEFCFLMVDSEMGRL